MPPIPPGPAGLSSFLSTIMHSVVDINPLTEAASSKATLTTFAGSMTPLWTKLTYSPFEASKPNWMSWEALILSTTVTPSKPALSAMVLHGREMAFLMMLIPRACSELAALRLFKARAAYNKAHPPPTTIPSSRAALVAQMASWTLSLTSPTSTYEPPPTLKIPTPPMSLESLSSSFSLS